MKLRQVFSLNLRDARKARRMSQEELADAAGLDRSYISSLELGSYNASLQAIEKLAIALDIAPDALLRARNDKPTRLD